MTGAVENKGIKISYPHHTELLGVLAFLAGNLDKPNASITVEVDLVGIG